MILAFHGKDNEVPSWDGNPSTFERFATECRWFQHSLKPSAKSLAAPRVWQRLVGSAKTVVRNLDPSVYSTNSGLEKLLNVLRNSLLQRLPVPDSFQRLERWSSLHKRHGETIPQLLVREEELFVELQQSLQRARKMSTTPKVLFEEPSPEEGAEDDNEDETEEAKDDEKKPSTPKAPSETSPTSSARTKTTKVTTSSSLGLFVKMSFGATGS